MLQRRVCAALVAVVGAALVAGGAVPAVDLFLDRTFGDRGQVITHVASYDIAYALAVQRDGRIVAAGTATNYNARPPAGSFAVVRYTPRGARDRTFGQRGIVTTSIPGSPYASAYAIAIQADSRILVAGTAYGPDTDGTDDARGIPRRIAIARYLRSGTLDQSFGTGGVVVTDVGGVGASAYAARVSADGAITVAGGGDGRVVVARYTASGDLDTTFAPGGVVTAPFDGEVWDALIATDGRVLALGDARGNVVLSRYDRSGTLDRGFGERGVAEADFGNVDLPQDIALARDGSVVVVGVSVPASYPNNELFDQSAFIARFTPDGGLDPTFRTRSVAYSWFNAVAVVRSGGIVAAGHVAGSVKGGDFRNLSVVRYRPDGTRDPRFAARGSMHVDISRRSLGNGGDGYALAFAPQGKLLVAGTAMQNFALVRFRALRRGS